MSIKNRIIKDSIIVYCYKFVKRCKAGSEFKSINLT